MAKIARMGIVRYMGDFAQVTVVMPKGMAEWLEEYSAKKSVSPSTMIKSWIAEIQKARAK